MLDPTKNRYPTSKGKEKTKHQEDGRRDKITFRVKPHTHQRPLEGSNKTLCAPGPRDPTKDWARHAFECFSVSWGGMGQQWPAAGDRSSGCSRPGRSCVWHKSSWRRSPLAPPQSHWADDPQTGEQLYQRNFRTVAKVLGPTTDFPTWGSSKGTEKPQGTWRSVRFDYRTSTGLGKQTAEGHKQNLVCTRTQEKGAVTPQKTEPDLPVSVQGSPAESRVDSGLPRSIGTECHSPGSHGMLA